MKRIIKPFCNDKYKEKMIFQNFPPAESYRIQQEENFIIAWFRGIL